jgi:hypothetical protein
VPATHTLPSGQLKSDTQPAPPVPESRPGVTPLSGKGSSPVLFFASSAQPASRAAPSASPHAAFNPPVNTAIATLLVCLGP